MKAWLSECGSCWSSMLSGPERPRTSSLPPMRDLGALEVGQHVVPRPAAAAELRPDVVVGRLAAHVEMAVDRARAAQHLAARVLYAAVVDVGAGRGLVAPVELVVVDGLVEAGRDLDPDVVVLAAGLDHRDGVLPDRRRAGWPARSPPRRRRRSRSRILPTPPSAYAWPVSCSSPPLGGEAGEGASKAVQPPHATAPPSGGEEHERHATPTPPPPASTQAAAPTSPSPWRPACRSCGSPR